jgi:general stress protein 26
MPTPATTPASRPRIATLVAAVCCLLGAAPAAHAAFSPEVRKALESSEYLYIATDRKDGSMSSVVPVWFMFDGRDILFATAPTSWKAKRIGAGRKVHVWVGTADGPRFTGKAELSSDPKVAEKMAPVYSQKYWIAWMGLFLPRPSRVSSGKTVIVRIPPPE